MRFPRSTLPVIHCHSRREAEQLLLALSQRLEDCGLELHPVKSKNVYCKDSNRHEMYDNVQFVFLGFCFRPRCAPSPSGKAFTSFLPAICNEAKKSIRQSIRRWCLQGLSTFSLVRLADRFNPIIHGWIRYYGAFYKQELSYVLRHLDGKLLLWVRRKFTQFRHRPKRARRWLSMVHASHPDLFAHWSAFPAKYV